MGGVFPGIYAHGQAPQVHLLVTTHASSGRQGFAPFDVNDMPSGSIGTWSSDTGEIESCSRCFTSDGAGGCQACTAGTYKTGSE